MEKRKDCLNGQCYCPIRLAVQKLNQSVPFDELMYLTRESAKKTRHCVEILKIYDIVCRDGKMICPDNP